MILLQKSFDAPVIHCKIHNYVSKKCHASSREKRKHQDILKSCSTVLEYYTGIVSSNPLFTDLAILECTETYAYVEPSSTVKEPVDAAASLIVLVASSVYLLTSYNYKNSSLILRLRTKIVTWPLITDSNNTLVLVWTKSWNVHIQVFNIVPCPLSAWITLKLNTALYCGGQIVEPKLGWVRLSGFHYQTPTHTWYSIIETFH